VDALAELLLRVADDLVLTPDHKQVRMQDGLPMLQGMAAFQSHPLHASILDEAAKDPNLSRLFPDTPHPSGRARPYRPSELGFQLVNAAAWHAALAGDTTGAGYRDRLAATLAQMRTTCKTGKEPAKTYVGLEFSLPDDTQLKVPWGLLRADRPSDRALYAYAGSGSSPPGKRCVLELDASIPVTITVTESFVDEPVPGFEDPRPKLVALAALLTLGPSDYSPALPWLVTRVSLLAPGPGAFASRRTSIEGPTVESRALPTLTEWIQRLASHPLPTIALDRSLSIMSAQQDYIYAFIDAVIAWENLFGTGDTQETSYRVSMNMAAVMSDIVDDRITLQREIKKLYSRGSTIVHGGDHPTPVEAHDLWERARQHTFQALSRLLDRYPHLIEADTNAFVAYLLGQAR